MLYYLYCPTLDINSIIFYYSYFFKFLSIHAFILILIYFFHHRAIPTLKEKPPYFSPTLTDPQWLPDIHYEDVDRAFLTADFGIANTTNNSVDGGSVGNGPATVGSAGKNCCFAYQHVCNCFNKHQFHPKVYPTRFMKILCVFSWQVSF